MNANGVKTFLLLLSITMLYLLVGAAIGGRSGMFIALIMAALTNLGAYYFSASIVLKSYGAKEIEYDRAPWLHQMVERLARAAEMPKPRVALIENPQPNAFATGRNPANGVVALTSGIIELLSKEELAGVIAHELAHIKNRDILTGSIVATIAGAISMLAYFGQFGLLFGGRDSDRGGNPLLALLLIIIGPIVASIVQMTISRTREYQADRTGAQIAGSGRALASALKKLESGARSRGALRAGDATAHMFIVNPISGRSLKTLFSTHPATEDRVEALLKVDEEIRRARPSLSARPIF